METPPPGSVYVRQYRARKPVMRRVVGVVGGRVCYSRGGNRLNWCNLETWQRWQANAKPYAETFAN